MHPCPCCGYKTLPSRGDYALCPVCWWEDEGLEPWVVSGPNGRTLVAAQMEYLAEKRPYRARPGRVRAPKKREAREPDWRPLELTEELLARAERSQQQEESHWDLQQRRIAEEIARNPEGSMKDFNAAVRALRAEATAMSHREVKTRLRVLVRAHDMPFASAHLELFSRQLKDEGFYRSHPVRTGWWLLRYSRPGNLQRRWAEVRTGTVHFASVRP